MLSIALAQREHRAGRLAEAAAAYRQILALRPDIAEVHNNLGNVLKDQGSSTKRRPTTSERVGSQARPLPGPQQPGRHPPRRASSTRPWHGIGKPSLSARSAEAHNNLGAVLREQGKLDEAAAHCERAVALKPDLFEAHNNLGNILRKQGRPARSRPLARTIEHCNLAAQAGATADSALSTPASSARHLARAEASSTRPWHRTSKRSL